MTELTVVLPLNSISLTLPVPPTMNNLYSSLVIKGRARHVRSAEGRAYAETVRQAWFDRMYNMPVDLTQPLFPREVPIVVVYTWYRARRSGDLDNRQKALLDALGSWHDKKAGFTHGMCFADDDQIVEIHGYRAEDPKYPRVEIAVSRFLDANPEEGITLPALHHGALDP